MDIQQKHDCITIYEAMQNIKNEKYIMPVFQREFVWKMVQIEKLWESILLGYPISSFLFWHIDKSNISDDTYFYKFLNEIIFNSRKSADENIKNEYKPKFIDTNKTTTAIIDGQQRLTSLYISLFGTAKIRPKHARRQTMDVLNTNYISSRLIIELNKNEFDKEEDDNEEERNTIRNDKKEKEFIDNVHKSIEYNIYFTDKDRLSPTQFELKRILENKFENQETRKIIVEEIISKVPANSKEYAIDTLNLLYKRIYEDKIIRFTEISDINQENSLEIFVRFNAGGNPLKKSEITMANLSEYWRDVKKEFQSVLTDSYKEFGYEFLIRSALMLYGNVVKANITSKLADNLKQNWDKFKETLNNLKELLNSFKIDISRFKYNWIVLIPIIYSIHDNPDYINNKNNIRIYLLRAIFFKFFQSGTSSKLQQLKVRIDENYKEITKEMLDGIYELSIEAKIEDVLNAEIGSKVAKEVLYYLSENWHKNDKDYDQDHLHPASRFNQRKPHAISQNEWDKWVINSNKLPNLQLLKKGDNIDKSNISFFEYYEEKTKDMTDEEKENYNKTTMIPKNVSLDIENFGTFFEERKKIMKDKIRELLK